MASLAGFRPPMAMCLSLYSLSLLRAFFFNLVGNVS